MFRTVALAIVLLAVSGCKLAVILAEGGEVQSTASGTCMITPTVPQTGTVCLHEITDTNYSETFTAVPDSGWNFVKWNSGDGFFCQDSTSQTCVISNVGTAGIPAIDALIATDAAFYIMPIFVEVEIPNTLTVDGKVWKQPAEFTNLSWNDINAVCPPVSNGDCDGMLNGINMDDWKWASIADVASMLSTYGPAIPPTGATIEEINSLWAPAFFSAGWQHTFSNVNSRFVSGWLRDEGFDSSQGTNGGIEQDFGGSNDWAWSGSNDPKTRSDTDMGAWFYHSP